MIILSTYNGVLLLFLLVLAFLNTLVHLPNFRREGLRSFKAAALIAIPLLILTAARNVLISSFQIDHIRPLLLIEFTLGVLLPTLSTIVLFVPNVRIH